MADVRVILSGDPMKSTVDISNIVLGNSGREEKVVINSIVSLGDVTAEEITDDQRALSDADETNMKQGSVCSNFEDKNKNIATSGNVSRRKRHRRGRSKKRKWKPYNKLTWDEKRQQEDRDSVRAQRVRAERFAHGKAVAPYNTTQFLMEDHNGPDLGGLPSDRPKTEQRQRRESGMDSDNYYSSPEDEEEFLQKEFCQVYQNIHAERLSSMTKIELIHEYMTLEDRVELLEQRIKDEKCFAEEKSKHLQHHIHNLEEEIKQLKNENEQLKLSDQVPPTDSIVLRRCKDEEMSTKTESATDDEKETLLSTCKALTKFSVECSSDEGATSKSSTSVSENVSDPQSDSVTDPTSGRGPAPTLTSAPDPVADSQKTSEAENCSNEDADQKMEVVE